jgi:hypothetical protein
MTQLNLRMDAHAAEAAAQGQRDARSEVPRHALAPTQVQPPPPPPPYLLFGHTSTRHRGTITGHVAIANKLSAHWAFESFVPREEAGVVNAPHQIHFMCELYGFE